jgi:hypothetical protein
MEIKNSSNPKDVVTIEESDSKHKGHLRLGIGVTDSNPRHVNLRPKEARAVAYALLCYAEQQQAVESMVVAGYWETDQGAGGVPPDFSKWSR